jgi:hypothetical protein
MNAFGLRPLTATALSLWLGILACVLGCAKVSTASASTPKTQGSGLTAAQCPVRDGDAGESCCRHGHDPAGGSGDDAQHTISCCPAETALIQKQNVVSASLIQVYVGPLALPDLQAANFASATATARSSPLRHVGRDILLQVHVLRI